MHLPPPPPPDTVALSTDSWSDCHWSEVQQEKLDVVQFGPGM